MSLVSHMRVFRGVFSWLIKEVRVLVLIFYHVIVFVGRACMYTAR